MLKVFSAVCLSFLLVGALVGCNGSEQGKAVKPAAQPDSVAAEAKAGGQQLQYRAVCLEKKEHGGTEYVLSRWLDEREKAVALGEYHGDFKYKGHAWRIEERPKPMHNKPK